jgi:hypothetical protein
MSGQAEWGPWIELDGSGPPNIPDGTRFECIFSGPGVRVPDHHEIDCATWPGFRWSWKKVRVGWFETTRRRVCHQPDYSPIIRVRLAKPPAQAVTRLAEIVAKPPALLVRDSDADRRVPKRVKA